MQLMHSPDVIRFPWDTSTPMLHLWLHALQETQGSILRLILKSLGNERTDKMAPVGQRYRQKNRSTNAEPIMMKRSRKPPMLIAAVSASVVVGRLSMPKT